MAAPKSPFQGEIVVVSPQPKALTDRQTPNKRKITPSHELLTPKCKVIISQAGSIPPQIVFNEPSPPLFPQGTFPGSELRIGKQTAFPKKSDYKFRDPNGL